MAERSGRKQRAATAAPKRAARQVSAVPKPNRAPNAINVEVTDATEIPAAVARTLLSPSAQAMQVIYALNAEREGVDVEAMRTELLDQTKKMHDGDLKRAESMLVAQAHTLDALFSTLASRAMLNMGERLHAADAYMRLALKAQSQCRTTLEALAEIKNPRAVAFVRQANIANGPQQVNNGGTANAPREESIENQPNELSRLTHEEGQRLAIEASGTAGATCPAMATVDALDRAKDAGGQSGGFTQRVERRNAADAARGGQGTEGPAARTASHLHAGNFVIQQVQTERS